MCVICVKPAGAQMPPKGTLQRCAMCNPHGFGFATKDKIFKTMSFEALYKELKKISKEEAVVIHFRYATHGSIKRSNCHPFKDEITGVSFAHNGILSITPYQDMTDSETAFRGILAPVIKEYGLWSDELALEVFNIIGGSRFAMIDKFGEVRLFGHFSTHNDCYYSNLNWMPYTERFTSHYKYAY